MNDKNKRLTSSIRLINERLLFEGKVEGNAPISIDYIPPLGDNLGYTSLELLLLSLSSCVGSAVLTFLRKMNKNIEAFNIHSNGLRKTEHPTGFSRIELSIHIKSDNVTDADVLKVLKLTEETYCPVWSMLKGNVEFFVNYEIEKAQ